MNLGMWKLYRYLSIVVLVSFLSANNQFNFELIKKGQENNNTLLVVGGIQGDEPGGFMSASVLSTHYKILKGSVWIVPNLNFYSIIKRNRGPYGDMNRKFAYLSKKDPEYHIVQRIKKLITNDKVSMVINLHDGSGYYREKYIDKTHAPYKWGQCSVIDQKRIDIKRYSHLAEISSKVVKHVNNHLLEEKDRYHQHNTKTRDGDKEMEKSLTYYAINHGKAAFGNEATKNLPTHKRVYYHLLALEKYMDIMGIKYKRDFKLTPLGVYNVLNNGISISLYDGKIVLPLYKLRHTLKYMPLQNASMLEFKANNPLVAVYKKNNEYIVQYGNRKLTRLKPQYKKYDMKNINVDFIVDSKEKKVPFGSILEVKKNFLVKDIKGYRVNIIGYSNKSKKETGILISKSKIPKKFSIDKKGCIYRVEYYTKGLKKDKFTGMVLVRFKD